MNIKNQFYPHTRYRLLSVLWLSLALLFAWDMLRAPSLGIGFFLLVSLGLLVWNVRAALSKVWLTEHGVTVFFPLTGERSVDFRQLVSVSAAGRFGAAITLIYHPRQSNGLVDLDRAVSLFLPTVEEQGTLLAALEERTPL